MTKREMITDPDQYFAQGCGRCDRFATLDCSTRRWIKGLEALRRICLDQGLVETAKWGHPCYMHAGRNIVMLNAFRGDFRLNFFNPELMQDPEGVLKPNGPNAQWPSVIYFTATEQVVEMSVVIRAYLTEAMGYADAGLRAAKKVAEIELPDELVDALDADPELAEAFYALTPGRQRSYAINLKGAKRSETRTLRIAKFRDRILVGKGALER